MICKECYANYGGQPGVVLCPLHEAAGELLEALQKLTKEVSGLKRFAMTSPTSLNSSQSGRTVRQDLRFIEFIRHVCEVRRMKARGQRSIPHGW